MRFLQVALMLVHAFVVSRLVSGAAVERFESARPQQHTAIINLFHVSSDRRMESTNNLEEPVFPNDKEHDDDYDNYNEDEYEDEDESSSDYEIELPQVAFSRKPKDSTPLKNEMSEGTTRNRKGKKRNGKGKKRDPCLKKYKDFCIHGICHHLPAIKVTSCRCHPNYSGERCHVFTQASAGRDVGGYNRTTALAVVAVVLSSLCLTIIGLLLALRFHKRGAYDVENEEKVKLGLAPNH
ncbi:hypothetical protein DPEC_G00020980 [Dallia pectoralis]|uniref:Uncharacterized protein n=1 Tax=Dallia pectoralis TaxID=75939 RepID=A0ACC2HGS8_DALPE|nr:hypothetical protein DPEC_G00020980 [Dallia pectoralis]